MTRRDDLLHVLTTFKDTCISLATKHGEMSYKEWEDARGELMAQPELAGRLPLWVVGNRWGNQFWSFIKAKSPHYEPRRQFIWSELAPVFHFVEHGATEPVARSLEPLLERPSLARVAEAWSRAQLRRETDPEGVITAARSLLESVCKFVLEEAGMPAPDGEDLAQLYRRVGRVLNLSPTDHTEQVFKQILTGCVSVVQGLGSLRNALGDAHGKAPRAARPSGRHADLALNLAGSLAVFLITTSDSRRERADERSHEA